MAVPNPLYYYQAPLQQVIIGNDGLPLAGGIVKYYSDPAFTKPFDVFEQSNAPNGTYQYANIGSVLLLSGFGSFVDTSGANYAPFLYPYNSDGVFTPYFIQVFDSNGAMQFTVTGWPPNEFGISGGSPGSSNPTNLNQITNPQFAEVLFSPLTNAVIPVTGTDTITPIAPGWFMNTTGAGNITITQVPLTEDVETNAPYALTISIGSSVTEFSIYQRIFNSPRLFATGAVAGYFEAATPTNLPPALQLTMTFAPSTGGSSTPIPTLVAQDFTNPDGSYNAISGVAEVAGPVNLESPTTGYVDVIITPTVVIGTTFSITSVQLIPVEGISVTPIYNEVSVPLQESLDAYYWIPELKFKPIPSLLTGWDFPLNPKQLGLQNISTTAAYIADQTIAASVGGTYTSTIDTSGGFSFTSGSANSAFYLLQYLSAPEALKLIGSAFSSNIFAWASTADVTATITMLVGSGIPLLSASPSTPVSMTSAGIITLSGSGGGWVVVPNPNLGSQSYATFPVKQVTVSSQINSGCDYGMGGWQVVNASHLSSLTTYAIIVSFSCPTIGTVVTVNSISSVPGLIPTRPAPQTLDEVLRECQYYYEKSYDTNVLPATATAVSAIFAQQQVSVAGGSYAMYACPFSLSYNTVKRTSPTAASLSIYALDGTGGPVFLVSALAAVTANASNSVSVTPNSGTKPFTSWGTQVYGTKSTTFMDSTAASIIATPDATNSGQRGWIAYQYVVDCRLGVI